MTERRSDEELLTIYASNIFPSRGGDPAQAKRALWDDGYAAGVADTVPDRDALYEAIYRALPKVSFSSAHDAQLATVAVRALLMGGEKTDGD